MKPVSNICGIVLAAGESKRMGTPKALLEFPDGKTLLDRQVKILDDAGCNHIACVLGSGAELVRGLDGRVHVNWLLNENWEAGQFTSIQTGLAWMLEDGAQGGLIMPVDVVLDTPDTTSSILEAALMNPHLDAIVPEYDERGGHPVYISKRMAMDLVRIDPTKPDARLDVQISHIENIMRLPVSDQGILRNVNTPEEWNMIKSEIRNPKL